MRKARRSHGTGNLLLDMLPPKTWQEIKGALQLRSLRRGEVLVEPGKVKHVAFPCGAVIATFVAMRDGHLAEAGIVGRDGMVPLCLFLGLPKGAYSAVVHIPGNSWCLSARAFRRLLHRTPALQNVLMRFTASFLSQLSVVAACNQYHPLLPRFSRRLLLISQRLGSLEIPTTQMDTARSLGVRRMSVAEVIRKLEGEGILESQRGLIVIRRPHELEQRACECYQHLVNVYRVLDIDI